MIFVSMALQAAVPRIKIRGLGEAQKDAIFSRLPGEL